MNTWKWDPAHTGKIIEIPIDAAGEYSESSDARREDNDIPRAITPEQRRAEALRRGICPACGERIAKPERAIGTPGPLDFLDDYVETPAEAAAFQRHYQHLRTLTSQQRVLLAECREALRGILEAVAKTNDDHLLIDGRRRDACAVLLRLDGE